MSIFKDILTIKNGKNQKAVENSQGRYPIYGSGGIMGYADSYICEPETVIIGRKGNINNPIFCEDYFWNIDTAFGLVADKRRLLPKYLFYFCKKFDFQSLNTTVTIPSLTKTNLLNIHINLPSLSEQKRIAAILDKATEIIALRKQQIEKLDLLVKSRFIEMFGDPVENPKNWKTKTIREASQRVSDGPFGSNLKSEHYTSSGIRVIRLQNIGVSQFIDIDSVYVSLGHYAKIKKYTCHAGEIVIGTLGVPNLRACIIPRHIEKAINKADCVHFIPDKNILNSFFACCYLNQPATLSLAEGSIHGQTRSRISMSQVANLPIFLPPLPLQEEFAAFVQQVDKSKSTLQQSLEKLELNYKALMQTYFG